MRQKTLKKEIKCTGIGLHKGEKVHLTLKPAPEDHGIVFWIKQYHQTFVLKLTPSAVTETTLATSIAKDNVQLATVEHLLAAIQGLEIDNLIIEVEGDEVPIMDGSATSFVFLMRSVGIKKQSAPKKVLALKKEVNFKDGKKRILARPYPGLKIKYHIEFPHPLIGKQTFVYENSPENFIKQLAKARTFGFLKQVELLHQLGKAKGGSLDNAIVLDEYGVINAEGLRFKDEFVRHKILDFLGDILLIGLPLQGYFEVYCSGHKFNNEFIRFLNSNRDLYLEEKVLQDLIPVPTKQEKWLKAKEPALA
ncbi:MAG: UDP-3-O-acyl-N-acetylglucosamine deacetylase [Desulfonauticus sp.]|nr:UDP-3-O-acyl-N-acetylglucosamine deacetylase [Desulfonauticus sp.]